MNKPLPTSASSSILSPMIPTVTKCAANVIKLSATIKKPKRTSTKLNSWAKIEVALKIFKFSEDEEIML